MVALLASAPAWIVKYPPLMDLPFHLATIRVIHDFRTAGFDDSFVLTLGRTQYVFYYLLGSLLAYGLGVVKANIVLMAAYFVGTILGLRSLLGALGRDPRLCLFVVPLLVNTMFLFGLLPFLLGIALMFWALASAVRYFERPSLSRGLLVATLALALFYSHIFPFGIFGLGFAALFPWGTPSRWVRAGLPAVPALTVLAWWTLFTDAGKLTRGALTHTENDPRLSIDAAIGDAHNWFTNVFRDTTDETVLVALLLLALLATGLSFGDRRRRPERARAYVLLPMACVVLYFTSTQGHDYIWLISQRFPILFAMTAIPLLRMPLGIHGVLVSAAALGLAAFSTVNTCRHFIQFQLEEVGDIDGALAEMAPSKRVCTLIYDRGSNVTSPMFVPFLHFGSYYQVRKGGVVMFTYAGYAHWPLDFAPGKFPPPGGPARKRWEWTPESVPMSEIFPWYDYVLTRGGGFHPPPGTFRLKWRGDRWAVWER